MNEPPPAVTDSQIAAFESQSGRKLPKEYVQLLKRRNGGYFPDELRITVDVSKVPEDERYYFDEGQVGFGSYFGLSEGDGPFLLTQSVELAEEWELPEGLLLIDGDGHTWIALDYRERNSEPGVVYVVADGPRVYALAKSFGEFFERLQVDAE
jgi:hypothetical protein